MKDKYFLEWLYNRLKKVYKEHYKNDYMNKLRCIIAATPEDQETPNTHIPDWEEMRKRVDDIDKGGFVEIPEGMSVDEFLNGKFESQLESSQKETPKYSANKIKPDYSKDSGWMSSDEISKANILVKTK